MTALLSDRSLVISDSEIAQARAVTAEISPSTRPRAFDVVDEQHRRIHVPAELAELVRTVLSAVASGASVTIAAMPDELTTTVAAKELGISRPTLMKMIRNGEIDSHKVGSHTRLRTEDVHALRRRKRDAQRAAFAELREFEEASGLDDN